MYGNVTFPHKDPCTSQCDISWLMD